MIEIKEANHRFEFKIIEKLATEILHEIYDPIIPPEHTDYFLTKISIDTCNPAGTDLYRASYTNYQTS